MSFNVLYDKENEGVFPGGLHSKEQIKILLCYLIAKTNVPVSMDFIAGVLQECGTANYFESTAGFSELIANGQLVVSPQNGSLYELSESGRFIVNNLSDELPVTIKEETLEKYKYFLHQRDIRQDNTVILTTKDNKTYVEYIYESGYDPETQQNRNRKKIIGRVFHYFTGFMLPNDNYFQFFDKYNLH